jgi:hypothetical protein
MAGRESIFTDDWRESLQAHYRDVVRRDDSVTEQTLTLLLVELGFREDELRQLKLAATIRAEDMANDFVPNLDIPPAPDAAAGTVHAGVDVDAVLEDVQDAPDAPENIPAEATPDTNDDKSPDAPDDAPPDPDAPQQMTLF